MKNTHVYTNFLKNPRSFLIPRSNGLNLQPSKLTIYFLLPAQRKNVYRALCTEPQ